MARGSDEVYGYGDCTAFSGVGEEQKITLEKAKLNCDSYALYALSTSNGFSLQIRHCYILICLNVTNFACVGLMVRSLNSDFLFTRGFLGSRSAATSALKDETVQPDKIYGSFS